MKRFTLTDIKENLNLTAEEISKYRTAKLQKLLKHVVSYSKFYQKRFKHLDIEKITADDMSMIPHMTKEDMLEHWDDIVFDKRISYDKANTFLQTKGVDEKCLFDQYHLWASGGSSGHRGIYVWSREDFAHFATALFRWRLRDAGPAELAKPLKRVIIQAKQAVHITPALFSLPIYPHDHVKLISADQPVNEIIDQLNYIQPTHLEGYPSVIYQLAKAQLDGLLKIQPVRMGVNSEVFTTQMRATVESAWPKVPINNHWSSTDSGSHGINCDYSSYQHLNYDVNIIEPVDDDGNPVPVGIKSAKIYTTCLYNDSFPLIRYELTDQITVRQQACPCGVVFPCIETVEGRKEDSFFYDAIEISPGVLFEGKIIAQPQVLDYQIFQTMTGMKVDLVVSEAFDTSELQQQLLNILCQQGLSQSEVEIQFVDQLQRHPETNKLKRFVPMT